MTSDDLKRALASVATAASTPTDITDDLDRARAAARTRNRRRFRVALGGVAAATVVAVGAALVVDDAPGPGDPGSARHGSVELVSEQLDASPYTFDLTPAGWSVQGQRPQTVTIAPDDGSVSSDPDDFQGKLVIMFDANAPTGRELTYEGRDFWVGGDSDYTTVATRTRGTEPAGVVRIQYPDDAGWDLDSMVAFLASVHVGPGARHGVG